ncbi:MAG: hypothetical protein A2Y78_04780 [Acidobacteria bacterium RBG_13_68_16]|nr:MAG: hypothetical protein A2Y78_04780 [Acidobacteria bacterium RBG_13_68_16]
MAQWATALSRSLGLGAPGPERASATTSLADEIGDDAGRWLDLVEEEHAYLMALAREQAEGRRRAREAREVGHGTA